MKNTLLYPKIFLTYTTFINRKFCVNTLLSDIEFNTEEEGKKMRTEAGVFFAAALSQNSYVFVIISEVSYSFLSTIIFKRISCKKIMRQLWFDNNFTKNCIPMLI